ncbi:hypothetical protein LL252_03545 [Alcanivorax marinus]|uniref:Alpha-D-phosphohexomutase alpha/beta/alpha domain-containing protein n=1 Tax=Alloalcanivorax marinus TaxID=1177169 RepID=A0A9Q3YLC1_9GAMM|nr:hypothetical protein [Alloalcanivorax marinus]MCC4307637.1 hypothetical protein [Alloalcanivorax marinus]
MAHSKNPFSGPAPLLLVAALLIAAAAGGLDHYLQLRAHQQAAEAARAQVRDRAASLGGLIARDKRHLDEQADTLRVRDALAGNALAEGAPDDQGRRLLLVPAGAALDPGLSYVLQDLLRQLAEQGDTTLSSRGGARPALLLARAGPGGALILEQSLDGWLADSARQLPAGATLTLEQDGLTVLRHGVDAGESAPRSLAQSGPFRLTLAVPPTLPAWATLLLPAGGIASLTLLGAALVLIVRRRRASPPAAPAGKPTATSTTNKRPSPPPAAATGPRPPDAPARSSLPPGPELDPDLFRADHLGGPGLDAEALRHLGRAIGTEAGAAGQQALFLALAPHRGEPRLASRWDALFEALAAGVLASGRQVLDLGVAPRPVLYYATEVLESQSGLYLAGDADAPILEVRLEGVILTGDALSALGQRLREGRLDQGHGEREPRDPGPRYWRDLGDDIVLARPMKVVIDDPAPGAEALFQELGCTVSQAGGAGLATAVPEAGADLGLAWSADGTRLTVVAADGATVDPRRVLMLLARDVLSRNPGSDVLFDVECSGALSTPVRQLGGRPVVAPDAGLTALKARLRESGAPLAGDGDGHICFADRWFGFDDGFYAAARLLEILSLQSGDSTRAFAALELPF